MNHIQVMANLINKNFGFRFRRKDGIEGCKVPKPPLLREISRLTRVKRTTDNIMDMMSLNVGLVQHFYNDAHVQKCHMVISSIQGDFWVATKVLLLSRLLLSPERFAKGFENAGQLVAIYITLLSFIIFVT